MSSVETNTSVGREQQEAMVSPEADEARPQIENAEHLHQYRDEVVKGVDQQADTVLQEGNGRLDKSVSSIDLPPDSVTSLKGEYNLDMKLAANSKQISQLKEDTTERIKATSGEPKGREAKKFAQLETNIGVVLDDESKFSAALQEVAPKLGEYLNISKEDFTLNEELYQKKNDDPDYSPSVLETPGSYFDYIGLRDNGFSQQEIADFIEAKANNTLDTELRQRITAERQQIKDLVDRPEIRQRLEAATTGIEDFYNDNRVPLPDQKLPVTQFVSKYEYMLLNSLAQGELVFGSMHDGGYFQTAEAAVIKLTEAEVEQQQFDDQKIAAYIHENFHGLSAQRFTSPEEDIGLADHKATNLKGGFLTKTTGNRRRAHSLNGLNEGGTELFARLVAQKQGITSMKNFGEMPYDGYVLDTMALVQALSGKDVPSSLDYANIDQQGLQELLTEYNDKNGTLSLGRKTEKIIGRHSFKLFDLLSERRKGDYAKFLASVQKLRKGDSGQPIEIDKSELQEYGLKAEELKANYPFLQFTDRG